MGLSMTRGGLALCAGLAVVSYLPAVVPGEVASPLSEVLVYLAGACGVWLGLRTHRPVFPAPWLSLLVGLLVFGVGSVAELVVLRVPGLQPVESALDLTGYAALLVAALTILVGGRGRWRRESLLDGATMVLAMALTVAAWVTARQPEDVSRSEISFGLPVTTALLLVVGVRLAWPGSGRSTSGAALCLAALLTLVGYGAETLGVPAGVLVWTEPLPLAAVAAVAFAALHPSMATLTGPGVRGSARYTRRVVGLGAALLLNPALVLLVLLRSGSGRASYLLALGIAALTLLTLWRIGVLDRDRESTRTALQATETRLEVLLQYAVDVIAIIDGRGRISYVNPAVEALLGRDPAACVGERALDFVVREDQRLLRGALADPSGAPRRVDVRLLHRDGSTRWVETIVSPRFDEEALSGHVLTLREVTDRKQLEEHLRHQASTDALTGLANRATFDRRLEVVTGDRDTSAALLFVDLDGFKGVNDRHGHAVGDLILDEVATRMTACVRDSDLVARIGGDEFAILLSDGAGRAPLIAQRCAEQLRRPMAVADQSVTVAASIGVAVTRPGEPSAELLERADAAMYAAKRGGSGVHVADG